MTPLPLFLAAAQVVAAPPASAEARYNRCVDLSASDPIGAEHAAQAWLGADGGFLARQCLGIAYAAEALWSTAAIEFERAAREAGVAKDRRSANYWVQAGNAWLAGGDGAKAKLAFDAALGDATLAGTPRGEAFLDRARASVITGDMAAARGDLDTAMGLVPDDPLAWLLSASLARRTGDLPRAASDIAEALKRSRDDAQVQLEAGNIAAVQGDEARAKAAWNEAARIAPTSPAGKSATVALQQFDH